MHAEDEQFVNMYLLLENELMAELDKTDVKKSKNDANHNKRLLWERQRRYDNNREKLRTTTQEDQRQKKRLNGPKDSRLEEYSREVQEMIKKLKDVTVDELWNFQEGTISKKEESEKFLNIYFLFLAEFNKLREFAKTHNEVEQTPYQFGSKPVLFLDSKFPKRWSAYIQDEEDYEEEIIKEIRQISKYKTILMLYFPQMELVTAQGPTPGSEDSKKEGESEGEKDDGGHGTTTAGAANQV